MGRNECMSEITPLTTEHLRILRDDFSTVRADVSTLHAEVIVGFEDMRKRFDWVQQSILSLKRDEVVTAEELAEYRLVLNQMSSIIGEMRTRLDLIEQAH